MSKKFLLACSATFLISCGGSDFSGNSVVPDSGIQDSNNVVDSNIDNLVDTTIDIDAEVSDSPELDSEVVEDAANETAMESSTPTDSNVGCTAGSTDCLDKIPRKCDQNGVWQESAECPFLCENGSCKGNCVPGTTQCKDIELQFCDTNGVWQKSELCAVDCDQNHNPPECIGNWCCSVENSTCHCNVRVGSCQSQMVGTCSGQYECCASSDKLQSCICIKSLFSYGAATCDEWVTLMNNDINYGLPEYKTVASCPLQ